MAAGVILAIAAHTHRAHALIYNICVQNPHYASLLEVVRIYQGRKTSLCGTSSVLNSCNMSKETQKYPD